MNENWWMRNNLRLIQNNIAETDADLDVDKLLDRLEYLGANALMLGTGGICAFYPTELPFHQRSPYLKKDLVGEAVRKCHERGLRYFARFDLSKAHAAFAEERPDWFFQTAEGKNVEYNGLKLTCLNGGYQQDYTLEILGEVMRRYPIDGVFFNMFGYQNRDYHGNDYGICRCPACKRRFAEMYGLDLPAGADRNDPAYAAFEEFKDRTVLLLLERIRDFVKGVNPQVAISTYHWHGVDVIRKESNTEIRRPLPFWLYSASENVQSVEDSWTDKTISNCCINAVGLDYRFMGVSKHQVALRLYESMAAGSGLDFCIIGPFEGYPDGENLETVRTVFRLHKDNESIFGRLISAARVALIKPRRFADKSAEKEYLGVFKALKESHVLFDVLHEPALAELAEATPERLAKYALALAPGMRRFGNDGFVEALQKNGTALVSTGLSFIEEPRRLDGLFGVRLESIDEATRSAYFFTREKTVWKSAPERDWVFLHGPFARCTAAEGSKLLPLVEPAVFGPPEKVGGHRLGDHPGAVVHGRNAIVPWNLGGLYYDYGYQDHSFVLIDLIDRLMGAEAVHRPIATDAPECVEIFAAELLPEDTAGARYLVQLINLSGFNGLSFNAPHPLRDIALDLRFLASKDFRSIRALKGCHGSALRLDLESGVPRVYLARLEAYFGFVLDARR